jgi:hypothetical protein
MLPLFHPGREGHMGEGLEIQEKEGFPQKNQRRAHYHDAYLYEDADVSCHSRTALPAAALDT